MPPLQEHLSRLSAKADTYSNLHWVSITGSFWGFEGFPLPFPFPFAFPFEGCFCASVNDTDNRRTRAARIRIIENLMFDFLLRVFDFHRLCRHVQVFDMLGEFI